MFSALRQQQEKLPNHARSALDDLAVQLRAGAKEINQLEARLLAWQ